MSQKILEKYRNLPKKKYKHKQTVPTFSEFIEYVLDLYEKNGEIDMHWAPVVNFCSVCKVSKIFILHLWNKKLANQASSTPSCSRHRFMNSEINKFCFVFIDNESELPAEPI